MRQLKQHALMIPVILAGASILSCWLLLCWQARAVDPSGAGSAIEPDSKLSEVVTDDAVSRGISEPARTTPPDSTAVHGPAPAGNSAPTNAVSAPESSGVLTRVRLEALGMIESGNNDNAIGGLGEVSRFQIMPSVWRQYSTSREYQDPDVAAEVARRHWTSLQEYFVRKTGREPTDFDLYVLWNTRSGYYASRAFTPRLLSPVVQDRARRFANLVEDGSRRPPVLVMATSR